MIPLAYRFIYRLPIALFGHHHASSFRIVAGVFVHGHEMGSIEICAICYSILRPLDPSNRWTSVAETTAANIQ
jgi:hypothetical protein